MTVKPTKKAVRTCVTLIIAVLLAAAALAYLDSARGNVKWKYAIPLLALMFLYTLLTAAVYLRTFVFSEKGVEVKLLFYRKFYRYEDIKTKREQTVIYAPSSRGKGHLYGSTAAGTSGMSTFKGGGSNNYLSPHINVDTGKDVYFEKVSFYRKNGSEIKTSDLFQYLKPLSLVRVFLLPEVNSKTKVLFHVANKEEFLKTLEGYGVTPAE